MEIKLIIFIFTLLCLCFLLRNCEGNYSTTYNSDSCENTTACSSQVTDVSTDSTIYTESSVEENTELLVDNSTRKSEHTTSHPIQNNTESSLSSSDNTTAKRTYNSNRRERSKEMLRKNCNCDLTDEECDINCCCDPDCDDFEKEVFSHCIETPVSAPSGHCFSSHLLYRNNTPYPVIKENDGLFCIAKDNFPERNWFTNQEIITSPYIFEKIWKRRKVITWPILHVTPSYEMNTSVGYKYGVPVWKYLNTTNEAMPIRFPVAFMTAMCEHYRPLLYLEYFETKCLQSPPLNEVECVLNEDLSGGKYCENLYLITSPQLLNETNYENSTEEAFLKMKQYLCEGTNCTETYSYPRPAYDGVKRSCHNVVTYVELRLIHNGSAGLLTGECYIRLGSVTPGGGLFSQEFQVSYLWPGAATVFRRSGTPGYRTGLPIIISQQNGNKLERGVMTLPTGDGCKNNHTVLFRHNVQLHCTINFIMNSTTNCTTVTEQLYQTMTRKLGKQVGVTGDPKDWLSVASLMKPMACSSHYTLTVHLVYAYYGSTADPQAKLLGVSAKLGLQPAPPFCLGALCRLKLTCHLAFTDISKAPFSKFAKAPILKIKLPKDFFYPFSSSGSNSMLKIRPFLYVLIMTKIVSFKKLQTFLY